MTHNKVIVSVTAVSVLAFVIFSLELQAKEISLDEYLRQVQTHHPFFTQQAFNGEIERQQQRRFSGDEDWQLKASPSFRHEQRSSGGSVFVAEEENNLVLNAGLERTYWVNGSRLSIDYNYYRSDQRFAPSIGSFALYGNGLSVAYTVPLMKNKGGVLSRLDYELQNYNIDSSEVTSDENQEQFLEQQGLLFIDWVFISEQQKIAQNRLALAKEEYARTVKKRRSHLVAEVDVLRTQDAVINARQNLSTIKIQWQALQVELATQSGMSAGHEMVPQFDLYRLEQAPDIDQVWLDLQRNARQLQAVDLQISRMERLTEGLKNELKPELDLVLGGGLSSESNRFTNAAQFDQPQYMIGVNFRYPLGQRSAKAEVSKAQLQQQQLRAERHSLSWQLEAQLRNLLVQLNELQGVINLNQEQIKVARLRTTEELNRYNQGRSELSFVIQSRDNEQNAQLAYAANAATYQKLWLRYKSLTDVLFASVGQTEVISKKKRPD
ncbi:MAG: TolC family protein [Gammaproteobacteria bacterium]|nr:TolC family protein [Gammaproteobacteria bacterium]